MHPLRKFRKIVKTEGICGITSRLKNLVVDFYDELPTKIRKLIHEKPHSILANIYRYCQDVRLTQQTQKTMKLEGLRTLSDLDFVKLKKSDTLFILGSGASVNELSDQDWHYIASCNSVGFNYWMAHPFVPDLYFTEPLIFSLASEDFQALSEARKDAYSITPLILNYKEWNPQAEVYLTKKFPQVLVQNLYYYAPYNLRLNNAWMMKLLLLGWRRKRFSNNPFNWLILQRGTLDMLIMLGYFAGFTEIVLVGVDLSNTAYFFENPNLNFVFRPSVLQTGKVHRTADPTLDINKISVTIDKYIYMLNEILLKPKGVCLFVASEKSRLYPRIGKYTFPEF